MARIASQSKGGYYPTPPEEMALVCKRLVPEEHGLINMMDPCAGKGEALRQAADYFKLAGAEPVTFAVELEESRYKEAKERLDKVVHGGYEGLRASNGVFSFLYLNPPYDWSFDGIRQELVFLNDLTAPGKYLQTGAVMAFCIPATTLKYVANLIAIRFTNVKVYRFTDKNYPVFKQVVLFGKRKQGRGDPEDIKIIKEMLLLMSEDPSSIPVLDQEDGWAIAVPVSTGDVQLFKGENLDPEEIACDLRSINWQKIEDLVTVKSSSKTELPKPLLPLKLAHIATAIAAGAVDGQAGDHHRRGVTKQITEFQKTEDEKNHIEIETQRFVSIIRVFSSEGVFDLK